MTRAALITAPAEPEANLHAIILRIVRGTF
jgi:hypothetical protein